MSKYTWDHEDVWENREKLASAVEESTSLRNTLVNLGIEPSSRRYAKLKDQCKKFEISLEFAPKISDKRIPDELVFTNPSAFNRSNGKELKTRAKRLGYIGDSCVWCGLGSVWNGKPISLQLDHIDGDWKNNLPENLRLLCPNCHSQTDTFTYKNIKKTTCKNGHPWVEDNLWGRTKGKVCKICAAAHNEATRKKERQKYGWDKKHD